MTLAQEGQRYWKHGDHVRVWVVDAIIRNQSERPPYAVLVREDGSEADDIDLSHLEDRNQYLLVP